MVVSHRRNGFPKHYISGHYRRLGLILWLCPPTKEAARQAHQVPGDVLRTVGPGLGRRRDDKKEVKVNNQENLSRVKGYFTQSGTYRMIKSLPSCEEENMNVVPNQCSVATMHRRFNATSSSKSDRPSCSSNSSGISSSSSSG